MFRRYRYTSLLRASATNEDKSKHRHCRYQNKNPLFQPFCLLSAFAILIIQHVHMDAYDTSLRATGMKISKGNIDTVVSMFPLVG